MKGGESMTNKERFLAVLRGNVHSRDVEPLIGWLEQTDFFIAPASTRFHECYEGGLVEHSINVYENLVDLCYTYDIKNLESITIVALLHDVCKANCYKTEMRWRKDEHNRWEQYPTYKFEEDFAYGGHGSKSVYLISNFLKLAPDEAVAINCHMGVENGKWEVNEAFRKCPLAFLLHTADMMSTIDYFNSKKGN